MNARYALAPLGALAILAACAGGDKATGPSTGPGADSRPKVTALVIRNTTSFNISHVYSRSCGTQLFTMSGPGTVDIAPGASRTVEVPAGCYDLGAVSDEASGSKHAHLAGTAVTARTTVTLTLTAAQFRTPASRDPECGLPEGSNLTISSTGDMLFDAFGDATADMALLTETVRQSNFWGVPAKVYVLLDGPGLGANAKASSAGWIGLGYNLYYQHVAKHGTAAAVGGTLAHEWGHIVQYSRPWNRELATYRTRFGNPKVGELEADAFAGFYMYLQGAQSWAEVDAFYQHMASLGNYDWTNPDFHGTPEQRKAAAYAGVYIGWYATQNKVQYNVDQLHQAFMTNVFRILGVRQSASASAAVSPDVAAVLKQLAAQPIEAIARGAKPALNIEAPRESVNLRRALSPGGGARGDQ